MKINTLFLIQFFFCLLFFLCGKMTFAQDCEKPTANLPLAGNNISAKINLAGGLFSNYESSPSNFQTTGFHTPTTVYPFRSTINSHGLWVGAIAPNDEIRVAASRYNILSDFDYTAGPISGNCEDYDRLWEVFGYEIQQHISDFEDNGIIDNPIPNIMAYPAHQNPLFETIHEFELPNTTQGLAPFFDNNGDQIYNPLDGDYPLPHNVSSSVIPAHIVWGIFNDGDHFNTVAGSESLNIEVQLTAWSLYCTDNEPINNTIFTSYKIINRGATSLDSTFVGFFTDGDLGCEWDDYFGSIPDMNTYYLYNYDSIDGSSATNSSCPQGSPFSEEPLTYGDNPPVQAVTFLNRSMSSLIHFNSSTTHAPGTNSPSQPNEYFNFLNGVWRNGNPLTVGGAGINPDDPLAEETKFIFPDNPNEAGWSMYTTNLPPGDRFIVSSTEIGDFSSDEQITLDLAFTFYQDETLNHIETVDLVYDFTPQLQQLYDDGFEMGCTNSICEEDCVWTGDADRDSIVTTCDILQVGLAFGDQDIERNKPLIWQPFEGPDWNAAINDINLKHTDCSGNSVIDSQDFELVELYFGKSYKTINPIDNYPIGNEISMINYTSGPQMDSMQIESGGLLLFKMNQNENLFGLALSVEFDTTFLKLISAPKFDPWDGATIANNYYSFVNSDSENGLLHYAAVKTDQENSFTTENRFLTAFFSTKNTDFAQVQTVIRMKNIKAILNDGTSLDYGANSFVVNIFNPDGSGILLNEETLANQKIEIFPNPTTNLLNVKFKKTTNAQFSIFDIYGKNVFQQKVDNSKETTLPIENLNAGIYFLKIEMNGKKSIHRFVKI